MFNSLVLDNNKKKITNWLSTGISSEKIKTLDSSLSQAIFQLANLGLKKYVGIKTTFTFYSILCITFNTFIRNKCFKHLNYLLTPILSSTFFSTNKIDRNKFNANA